VTETLCPDNSDEVPFTRGPVFIDGPEFEDQLALFLNDLGSQSLKLFGNFWFDAIKDGQLPTWRSLRPHTRPDLILSAFMLERPAGEERIYIRFIGNNLVESLGGEITGFGLDEIAQDETLRRWNASNAYCIEKQAVASVDFDLGFSGRHFKKATTVTFPLRPETNDHRLVGIALWRS